MSILIEVYILICALLLLFDIVFLVVKNRRNQEFYPKNENLEKEIRSEISFRQREGGFSQGFEERMRPKLAGIKNLITLMDVLETERGCANWFRPMIFSQIEEYQKKNDYEQAYYAYTTSFFDYEQEPVPRDFAAKFTAFLDSKSLYTFSNTMDALYRFGETDLLMTAMGKVDERQGAYHKKLLVDGLLASKANFSELNAALMKHFDGYTPFLQECLLDFFRMNGYDISDLCMRLLQSGGKEITEVHYSAMRYFIKNPTDSSKAYFLDVLSREGSPWVEQMMAIQALERYEDSGVRDAIMGKITSANWYVRTNAIAYLYHHGLTKEAIFDILYLRDRYANEALLYQYRNEKEMSRYIMDTMQLLQQQEFSAEPEKSDAALPV